MAAVFEDRNSLFDFVVRKGHGIKGLVDSGIDEVPELYIQPQEERFADTIRSSSTNPNISLVPIDLSKLDGPQHDKVVEDIVSAADTLGFFQVINHGVDLELLESLKDVAHRFFAQSAEEKAAYLKENSPSPFVKYTSSFAPDQEKVLEWRDFISMMYPDDVNADKFWPKDFKKELLEYAKSTHKMVRRLFEILIENLGVKLDESMLEALIGLKVVNMNFYPVCPSPELTIGAARHSDMGTLTVLLQDGIGGLYVKIEEDVQAGTKEEWIEIPPISGALVVNVGDALQILSNGRYKSAEHKVRTTNKHSRVSIPYFVAPAPTVTVGPLTHTEEGEGKALYREIVWKEYIDHFFGKGHEGKNALDLVKIN